MCVCVCALTHIYIIMYKLAVCDKIQHGQFLRLCTVLFCYFLFSFNSEHYEKKQNLVYLLFWIQGTDNPFSVKFNLDTTYLLMHSFINIHCEQMYMIAIHIYSSL